jgi:hypothetical protein
VDARWKRVQKVLCGPPHCQMVAPAKDFFMMASLNLGDMNMLSQQMTLWLAYQF